MARSGGEPRRAQPARARYPQILPSLLRLFDAPKNKARNLMLLMPVTFCHLDPQTPPRAFISASPSRGDPVSPDRASVLGITFVCSQTVRKGEELLRHHEGSIHNRRQSGIV
jgi:hypothetical protein